MAPRGCQIRRGQGDFWPSWTPHGEQPLFGHRFVYAMTTQMVGKIERRKEGKRATLQGVKRSNDRRESNLRKAHFWVLYPLNYKHTVDDPLILGEIGHRDGFDRLALGFFMSFPDLPRLISQLDPDRFVCGVIFVRPDQSRSIRYLIMTIDNFPRFTTVQ